MSVLNTFVTTCLIASGAVALAIPPVTPAPPKHLFARAQMSEGCGFECTEDMGHFTCEREKQSHCLTVIREASCSTEQIESVEFPPNERWDSVYAGETWENMTIWYTNAKNEDSTALPFTRWMADKFNARDNMDCHALADNNNCATTFLCDEVAFPAGFLILNSFTTINNMMWNFYDSIYNAKSDIESSVGAVSDTFAPMDQGGLDTKIIIDLVLIGYASAAAPIWNTVTKRLPFFTNPRWAGRDGNGLVKDWTNGLVAGGLTLAKDLTPAKAALTAQNDLTIQLGAIVELWADTAAAWSKNIFSGEADTLAKLGDLIRDGAVSQTPTGSIGDDDGDLSAQSIKERVKKSIFVDLIPRAWRLSNLPLGPFILQTKKGCDETPDEVEVIEGRTFCVDDSLYVLASTADRDKNCKQVGDYSSCLEDFKDLPGTDTLDGTSWGGLTVEDIVVGSVRTWKMHGEKNLGKMDINGPAIVEQLDAMSDPMLDDPENTFVDDLLAEDVRAAGIIDLPVCDVFVARRNWDRSNDYPEWPCDKP